MKYYVYRCKKKQYYFGSYAKNTQNQNSDIDIVIDGDGKIKGLNFFALIDIIREKFGKDVDVLEKSEINKDSKIDKEIKKNRSYCI